MFLAIGLSFSCEKAANHRSVSSEDKIYHIVFDIDWTLTSTLREEDNLALPRSSVVEVQGKRYRIHDWAREMISDLTKRDNVKISFFSGGTIDRNTELLKSINLGDGSNRSFFDIAEKVLGFDDLTDLSSSTGENVPFSVKFKKDLSKISDDLDNILLIEDDKMFSLGTAQKRNLLWSGIGYRHFETYEDVVRAQNTGFEKSYIPGTVGEWHKSRNKLAMVHSVVDGALEKAEREGISFIDSISSQLSKKDFETSFPTKKSKTYLKDGMRKLSPLRKFREGANLKKSRTDCFSALTPLMYLN